MGDAAVYDAATIRAERDALKAEVEKLRDAVSWHRCSTHGDVDPTAWGCPECVRELRAEVALRKSEVELFRDKLKARCDEVAKLKAACAAKDAALNRCADWFGRPSPHFDDKDSLAYAVHAALSDTAGANMIDASGAVEARLHCEYGDPSVGVGDHWFLTDNDMDYTWAGSKVKIVRVKP